MQLQQFNLEVMLVASRAFLIAIAHYPIFFNPLQHLTVFKWTFPALTGISALAYFIQNSVLAITRNQRNPQNSVSPAVQINLLIWFEYTLLFCYQHRIICKYHGYQLRIICKYHGIIFIFCASSFIFFIASGFGDRLCISSFYLCIRRSDVFHCFSTEQNLYKRCEYFSLNLLTVNWIVKGCVCHQLLLGDLFQSNPPLSIEIYGTTCILTQLNFSHACLYMCPSLLSNVIFFPYQPYIYINK